MAWQAVPCSIVQGMHEMMCPATMKAWHGMRCPGMTYACVAMAWHGMSWHGMAWHDDEGMSWHGMAWQCRWHAVATFFMDSSHQRFCAHARTQAMLWSCCAARVRARAIPIECQASHGATQAICQASLGWQKRSGKPWPSASMHHGLQATASVFCTRVAASARDVLWP